MKKAKKLFGQTSWWTELATFTLFLIWYIKLNLLSSTSPFFDEQKISSINYDRDFSYNYFAFRMLEKSKLLKINNKTAERPQHMLMRVALDMHGADINRAIAA